MTYPYDIVERERRRANVALAFLLDEYPPADQIGPRDKPWTWPERRKPRPADLADAKSYLATDILRYEELRTMGGDALSAYDLTISSSDDGPNALDTALSLKNAHISWSRSRLAWLEAHFSAQGDLFESDARPAEGAQCNGMNNGD